MFIYFIDGASSNKNSIELRSRNSLSIDRGDAELCNFSRIEYSAFISDDVAGIP